MGDSEFAKAMVPPSPPRNMMEMQQQTSSSASTEPFMKVNKYINHNIATGIADTEANVQEMVGKKKTISNINKPRNNNKDIVPRLKIIEPPPIAIKTKDSILDSDDDDELQDEYSIPLSERETALTSRDRDLIEKGDWSEVCMHTELSDNDYSLLGVRGVEGIMISSFQQQQQQNGSKVGSNIIHGPRGGRQFRSSVATNTATTNAAAIVPMEDHLTFKNQQQQRGFKIHPNGFQVEDSDEESINGKQQQQQVSYTTALGGVNKKQSPRNKNNNDRLDPIPLPYNEEAGILSGKRYDNNYQALSKVGNINNSNGSSSIQTNNKKDMKSYGAKDVDYNNSNIAIYPSLPSSEERFKKEAQSKYNNNTNNVMSKNNIRRSYNSQDPFDSLVTDDMNPTILAFNENNNNDDLNNNNQNNIRPKISIQQNRQNAALSRLKANGLVLPTSNNNQNLNNNIDNNEFSLNINGSGLGGGGANAEAMIARPANKNKNNNAR